jgi:hypothetical protein
MFSSTRALRAIAGLAATLSLAAALPGITQAAPRKPATPWKGGADWARTCDNFQTLYDGIIAEGRAALDAGDGAGAVQAAQDASSVLDAMTHAGCFD